MLGLLINITLVSLLSFSTNQTHPLLFSVSPQWPTDHLHLASSSSSLSSLYKCSQPPPTTVAGRAATPPSTAAVTPPAQWVRKVNIPRRFKPTETHFLHPFPHFFINGGVGFLQEERVGMGTCTARGTEPTQRR